jgi:hypothetical protein
MILTQTIEICGMNKKKVLSTTATILVDEIYFHDQKFQLKSDREYFSK